MLTTRRKGSSSTTRIGVLAVDTESTEAAQRKGGQVCDNWGSTSRAFGTLVSFAVEKWRGGWRDRGTARVGADSGCQEFFPEDGAVPRMVINGRAWTAECRECPTRGNL